MKKIYINIMAQNFRRRINLFPNSFYNIQNTMTKFKEMDLVVKADNDTFNKSNINEITPIKIKKLDPSLLDSPIIEKKKERRISIHSPLYFNEDSSLKTSPISTQENDDNHYIEKSSELKITNFSPTFSEEIEDFFPNFNTHFICKKIKKLIKSNKKSDNGIIFIDENNQRYQFELFDDQDIFGEDNDCEDEGRIINLNIHDDENSDDEKIQHDYEICLNKLEEAIDYYSKNPNCISRK